MNIIVQKYGGTSTRNQETRTHIYKNVVDYVHKGYKVVVVVSAMGRYPDPYATDTLLSLVSSKHLTSKENDELTSIGETISSLVIKSELEHLGFKVASISNQELGIITDNHYQNANILSIDGSFILKQLHKADIIVCPGFQGHTINGQVTTLGRGGSDLSAIIIGIAVHAKEVEIYSDVNGIYTIDPKINHTAKKIDTITFYEMLELARNGTKVLNHRCIELAAKNNITIHARSSFEKDIGTYVIGDKTMIPNTSLFYTINSKQNKTMITLTSIHHSSITKLFQQLSIHNINVDAMKQISIDSNNMKLDFIIDSRDTNTVMQILNDQSILFVQKEIQEKIGCISIEGIGIKQNKSLLYQMYATLIDHHIDILLTSSCQKNIVFYLHDSSIVKAKTILSSCFENEIIKETN